MNYIHFMQGAVVWAIVATILTLIIYAVSYALSLITDNKTKGNFWHIFFIVLTGCGIIFTLQTVLHELGFQPETNRLSILAISIICIIIARIYHYLTYKKKGT